MGCSPTRSWPRGSWTAWSTAPTTCSCRARATAPTSARAPTRPTRHKEVAQARTAPVGVSDSLIDPLMNSLIVHTIRMVTTARWSHPRISTAGGGGRCPWSHGRPGTVRSGRMVAPALCAVVAWSPGTAAPWRRERRGRLQEAVARLAAAGRVQPAQMLAADLPTEPVAELLPDVGHRGPGERAGLLGAQPAELQALDVPAAPAVHHGQQGGVGAGADRGPGL